MDEEIGKLNLGASLSQSDQIEAIQDGPITHLFRKDITVRGCSGVPGRHWLQSSMRKAGRGRGGSCRGIDVVIDQKSERTY
jgi:hypothetical protein